MVKATKRPRGAKLGKQDRWPSDYGVRDAERQGSQREGTAPKHAQGAAENAPGRKGRGGGGQHSARESRASAGRDRKDKR
jgi:hypothetical protein